MNKVIWIIILVIVLLGIYWAMNSGAPTPTPADTTTTTDTTQPVTDASSTPAMAANMIAAGDQKAGKVVMIDSVVSDQDFSIVVHKDLKGAPGAVIGTLTLKAGSYTNQSVPLTVAIKAGDTVYPMLHADTNGDGKYTSDEEADTLTDASGAVLMQKVMVK